ncbi:hypothetical protein [Enterococcus phage vB_EfaS_EF1c55]|nr:hypothetical protein [Enterococcus phage vB_EfaS_EF1c55]
MKGKWKALWGNCFIKGNKKALRNAGVVGLWERWLERVSDSFHQD